MKPYAGTFVLGIVAVIVMGAGCIGCSFSIDTEMLQSPTGVSAIAIGRMEADDPDRDRIARRFRRALVIALRETEAFSNVISPAPPQLPEDAILITGRFAKVNEGSEMLRFGLGLGLGSPSLRARFEISDSTGRILAAFEESARSFEGTGYAAHWNPANIDELADDFAVETAEAIARWSRGEELALSIW